ncbi:MAG: hypothetical protein AB1752_00730 [Candidatus Zixiibacteriota bacterium]
MFRSKRFSRAIAAPLLTGLAVLLGSCGRTPLTSAPSLEIAAHHAMEDGKVIWDPNEEPVLALSVRGDATDPLLASVQWTSTGWGVDLTGRVGPDLRVAATTPGCGFGGFEFQVTALADGGTAKRSITVRMEPYFCPGSPWIE